MNNVVNINQLNQLINDTYIYAVIVALAAVAVAFLVANVIAWEGGKDRSYIKRRVAYIIIGIVTVFGFWLYNDQVVMESIKSAGFRNMFGACNTKCLGLTTVVYAGVSLAIMFIWRHTKFGSILGRIKK